MVISEERKVELGEYWNINICTICRYIFIFSNAYSTILFYMCKDSRSLCKRQLKLGYPHTGCEATCYFSRSCKIQVAMHHKKGALQVLTTNKLPLLAKNFSSPRFPFHAQMTYFDKVLPGNSRVCPWKFTGPQINRIVLQLSFFSGFGCETAVVYLFEAHNLPPKKMNPQTHPTGERKLKHAMAGAKHLLSKKQWFSRREMVSFNRSLHLQTPWAPCVSLIFSGPGMVGTSTTPIVP